VLSTEAEQVLWDLWAVPCSAWRKSVVTGASKCPSHRYFLKIMRSHGYTPAFAMPGMILQLMTGALVFLRPAERPGLPGKWCCDDL